MKEVRLIWSLSTMTPDSWIIDQLFKQSYTLDDMKCMYVDLEWEMTDDISAVISNIVEQSIPGWFFITDLADDQLDEFRSHIESAKSHIFVLWNDAFQVIDVDILSGETHQVHMIELNQTDGKYIYIGYRGGFYDGCRWNPTVYLVGTNEKDIVRRLLLCGHRIIILKLPINHKGGPAYAFKYMITGTPYNKNGHWDDVIEKDNRLYFDVEPDFPQDPIGYYDRCMELTAGELRRYDGNGKLIESIWEYWNIERKGYEDFMDQEMFEEMMRLEHPILWYHDEDEPI